MKAKGNQKKVEMAKIDRQLFHREKLK